MQEKKKQNRVNDVHSQKQWKRFMEGKVSDHKSLLKKKEPLSSVVGFLIT